MEMTYDVICELSLEDLINSVNERLNDGWELQGGVSMMFVKGEYINPQAHYTQAIVRCVPDSPKAGRP